MFVKACGITEFAQIDWACELGYSAVGFVVYPKSPRYVSKGLVEKMLRYAHGKIKTVVVSLNFRDVSHFVSMCDFVQIYEYVECENLIFASSEKPEPDMAFKYFMYDSSKGSGIFEPKFPEWLKDLTSRLIYSGGLSPENVSNVVKELSPAGVDVSSGIEESPGKKSYRKMADFIAACKEAANG